MIKLSNRELKSIISDSMSICDITLKNKGPEIRASCLEAVLQSKIAEKAKEKED